MAKVFRVTVRLDSRLYVALGKLAASTGRELAATLRDILAAAVGSQGNGSQRVSDNVAAVDDEVEGRNPLEYVRAVREELERRARQYQGAKRW